MFSTLNIAAQVVFKDYDFLMRSITDRIWDFRAIKL